PAAATDPAGQETHVHKEPLSCLSSVSPVGAQRLEPQRPVLPARRDEERRVFETVESGDTGGGSSFGFATSVCRRQTPGPPFSPRLEPTDRACLYSLFPAMQGAGPALTVEAPSIAAARAPASALQPEACLEDRPDDGEAGGQEEHDHGEADGHPDIGRFVEAPAKAADEIEHGVEVTYRPPERREHVDRVEAATQEHQRRDHQERHELQLLEIVRPDADDEAEEAEGHRRQHEKERHQQRMLDVKRYEQAGRRKDDGAQND